MYVFDTSPLSTLFKNYYPKRFPTLWAQFDELIKNGAIVSTREVGREVDDGPVPSLRAWAKNNPNVFAIPTAEEGGIIAKIYAVPHFQQNIEQQKLLKGGRNADPFVMAKACAEKRTVVTIEADKPNSAKIPAICKHMGIGCMNLEEFMEAEDWTF
ncbi:PIN domain-containing protein [Mesorhizobium delmotii]|uniref:DUF4411 family protein n=1 Tax=Mesorhizobium delmotii TaxID=1631247 RepID=A0A2P9AR25_9HYPH|nr:PIN domain-containing protein [Mesorhizobium delmotii]SJM33604.1 conserved hypothetical protein [Mesorhizobium delmotii]